MNKQLYKDALGWGLALWLIGYVLGFVFFAFVPASLIGWVITPIGVLITLWVLFKKIHGGSLRYYLSVGIVWSIVAIICDYLFLVLVLKPADGYYKFDVYLYYVLALILPVIPGKNSTLPKGGAPIVGINSVASNRLPACSNATVWDISVTIKV